MEPFRGDAPAGSGCSDLAVVSWRGWLAGCRGGRLAGGCWVVGGVVHWEAEKRHLLTQQPGTDWR